MIRMLLLYAPLWLPAVLAWVAIARHAWRNRT